MRMTDREIAFFTDALNVSTNYLEYGAGGSTKLAARIKSVQSIVSVESDQTFLDVEVLADSEIQQAILDSRLNALPIDIGPTGEWGRPIDSSKSHLWPNYALSPYQQGRPLPDLILVDGIFRVACCLTAALEAPDATLLVHDYTLRPDYKILEEFFTIEEVVDTLAKLKPADHFDAKYAESLLRKYLYQPRDKPQTIRLKIRRFLSIQKYNLNKHWR